MLGKIGSIGYIAKGEYMQAIQGNQEIWGIQEENTTDREYTDAKNWTEERDSGRNKGHREYKNVR